MMDSATLQRWERQLTARKRNAAKWWQNSMIWVVVLGAFSAIWVHDAFSTSTSAVDRASHRWLITSCGGFLWMFLQAPNRYLWRPDAAILARLPISGLALFDSGWRLCAADGGRLLLMACIAGTPLIVYAPQLLLPHVAMAITLTVVVACAGPAACVTAGTLVTHPTTNTPSSGAPTAVLGGLPGFVGAIVIVLVIASAGSLYRADAELSWQVVCTVMSLSSLQWAWLARTVWSKHLPTVLRDVTTLDRVYLASLEIQPASRLHRAMSALLDPQSRALLHKHSQLMTRRYPMAGVVGFVLACTLLYLAWFPSDDVSWYVATIVAATTHLTVLMKRLRQIPITNNRLEQSVGFRSAQQTKAALVWGCCWWLVFIAPASVWITIHNAGHPLTWLYLLLVILPLLAISSTVFRRTTTNA
jgi:hypothetical protein